MVFVPYVIYIVLHNYNASFYLMGYFLEYDKHGHNYNPWDTIWLRVCLIAFTAYYLLHEIIQLKREGLLSYCSKY